MNSFNFYICEKVFISHFFSPLFLKDVDLEPSIKVELGKDFDKTKKK